MSIMKWKRQQPGCYTSGMFRIEGAGRNWALTFDGEPTSPASFASKKEAKTAAEVYAKQLDQHETEAAQAHSQPLPPMDAPQEKRGNATSEYAKLRDEINQLASLRASVDYLSEHIGMLTAATRDLLDATSALTTATRQRK